MHQNKLDEGKSPMTTMSQCRRIINSRTGKEALCQVLGVQNEVGYFAENVYFIEERKFSANIRHYNQYLVFCRLRTNGYSNGNVVVFKQNINSTEVLLS